MATVTICSDFGAPQNKVCHYFHCFPICLPFLEQLGRGTCPHVDRLVVVADQYDLFAVAPFALEPVLDQLVVQATTVLGFVDEREPHRRRRITRERHLEHVGEVDEVVLAFVPGQPARELACVLGRQLVWVRARQHHAVARLHAKACELIDLAKLVASGLELRVEVPIQRAVRLVGEVVATDLGELLPVLVEHHAPAMADEFLGHGVERAEPAKRAVFGIEVAHQCHAVTSLFHRRATEARESDLPKRNAVIEQRPDVDHGLVGLACAWGTNNQPCLRQGFPQNPPGAPATTTQTPACSRITRSGTVRSLPEYNTSSDFTSGMCSHASWSRS